MSAAISLDAIPGYVAAVGALGVAAFGAVEAIGKTLFVFDLPAGKGAHHAVGLPYVGFNKIQLLLKRVGPALKASYGDDYENIIQQQYRSGRGQGQAPDTIRQGVRLGLPFLSIGSAAEVIEAVWGMPSASAAQLARALVVEVAAPDPQASPSNPPAKPATASPSDQIKASQALAARFATALDTRVQAAFDVAEEVYQARAQLWAGVIAVGLSVGYQGAITDWTLPTRSDQYGQWAIAFVVGLVAVPLAPAAKDLSSSLSDALTALGKLRGAGK